MSNAIQTSEQSTVIEFDQKNIDLIRSSICKNATPEEFEVFIQICKSTQLNPLFKQIYFIKRGGAPTHQTAIDGLRLIADRTKKYVPGREPTFTYAKDGSLHSATSYVKKLAVDGSWHEVSATAIFKEYNAGINQWKTMPHAMLAKCAEALALRRAFPADMHGLYTRDEMYQAEVQTETTISSSGCSIETCGMDELKKKYSQHDPAMVEAYATACAEKKCTSAEAFAKECLKAPPLFDKYFDTWLEKQKSKPQEETLTLETENQ